MTMHIDQSRVNEFIALRRHIHRHPELAYEERQTSELIAARLRTFGYQVFEGIAGTGVVGKLSRPGSTASIALRADLDALPIQEINRFEHASTRSGVMHACGHDGHIAMLLAASESLARSGQFSGTLYVIFQPAEEIGEDSGGKRMIEAGLFDQFPADAVFALHNHPGLEAGHIMARAGAFMAANDKVRIMVKGIGGHAARPHLTVDAALVASSIVVNLQSIVARNINPAEVAVVSVGRLASGDTYNVIPGTAELELSIRSFDEDVRNLLQRRVEDLVRGQAQSFGAEVEIEYVTGYPVLVNDPEMTEMALQVAREVVGEEAVMNEPPKIMGSEDFAYMLQVKRGCLIRIGNGLNSAGLHHPQYDFNDSNIAVGAAFWQRLVERFLAARSDRPFLSTQEGVNV